MVLTSDLDAVGDSDPTATDEPTEAGLGQSPSRRAFARFLHRKASLVALVYVVILVIVAIIPGAIAPHSPNAIDIQHTLATPSAHHWLGTDSTGRDLFSRLLFATQTSLLAALIATIAGLTVGFLVGLISGYVGGKTDYVLMRICDALISIPPLLMAIAIIGALGPSTIHAMLGLAVVFTPTFARLVRSQTLEIREETYVMAALGLGFPHHRVLFRHIVPNIIPPLIVQAFLTLGFAILGEGSLSFLGLSVQPPTASWGNMVNRAFDSIYTASWQLFIPGLAIVFTIWAFNVIGEGLRSSFAVR